MKRTPLKILIVEDEKEIRLFLSEILQIRGYETLPVGTYQEAIYAIENEPFSIVLLDIFLPDGNGLSLLKKIRERRGNVPVIMQTALSEDACCIQALKMGADDFVTKPVRQGPLLARIEAVLRRARGTPAPFDEMLLRSGVRAFYPTREIVFSESRRARLTHKEAALLRFLFSKGNAPSTTEELLLNVWNANPSTLESSCIPSLVSRLRKKLEDAAEIRALYNGGYVLVI